VTKVCQVASLVNTTHCRFMIQGPDFICQVSFVIYRRSPASFVGGLVIGPR